MPRLIAEKCVKLLKDKTFHLANEMACFLQSIFSVQENKRFKTVHLFGFYVCEDGIIKAACDAFLLFMRKIS